MIPIWLVGEACKAPWLIQLDTRVPAKIVCMSPHFTSMPGPPF